MNHKIRASHLLLILFAFATASQMSAVLLPYMVSDLGYDFTSIGWSISLGFIFAIFLRPFTDFLIRKLGAKIIFAICFSLLVIGLSCLSFLAQLELLIAMRTLIGLSGAVFYTAGGIIYSNMLPDHKMGEGLSVYSLVVIGPSVFTPLLALILRDAFTYREIFLMAAAFSFLLLTTVLFYPAPPKGAKVPNPELKERGQFGDRRIILIYATVFLSIILGNGIIYTLTTFMPIYLDKIDPFLSKVFFSIQAPLVVLSRFFMRKMMPKSAQFPTLMVSIGTFLSVMSVLLFIAHETIVTVALVALCAGGFLALLFPMLMTIVSLVAPDAKRGLMIGIYIACADIGAVFGMVSTGYLSDWLGYRAVLVVWALGMAAGLVPISFILGNLLKPAESIGKYNQEEKHAT